MIKDYSELNKEELLKVIEKLESRKKYGLIWDEEKVKEQFEKDSENALPVLKEIKNKEIADKKGGPVNVLIEGDNYHALSVLNFTHQGKIDVIYIDPPYNTGSKDFKYNDRYVEKEDSYRHSKWLSFITKRLKLAKSLLSDRGVIFISIGDDELAQLKIVCDEIFGENSFAAIFPWKKRTAKSDVPFGISQEYEWILCYAQKGFLAGLSLERKYYKTPDYPNDRWRLSDLTTQKVEADRPNSAFDLIDPKTGRVFPYNPKRLWGITKDTFKEYYKKGKIVFPDDYDFLNIKTPAYRVFESEDIAKALKKYGSEKSMKTVSTNLPKEVGMSEDGNRDIFDIFGKRMFSYPKPILLIEYLLSFSTSSDSIILDFFAGSGTTGHAVLNLNNCDNGNRKFILCTNNVELDGDGNDKNHRICSDVCYPRIEKIVNGYKNLKGEKIAGLGGSLKYFKTKFVKNASNKDDYKIRLTKECTEMLCLREGIFNEVKKTDDYHIFQQGDKTLAVYYSLDQKALADLKKDLNKINGEKILYCFTLDPLGLNKSDFIGWNNVSLEPIPQKILDIYKQIYEY